jgi:hypothetical protein
MAGLSPISPYGGAADYGVRPGGGKPAELTEEQQREVARLEARDREVRAHEQAHIAASGGLSIGGAQFTYTRGPDGKQYATGGEVQLDISAGRTPQETIARAQAIQRAASAPASPSGQDRAVAAAAARMELQARQQLAEQRTAESEQAMPSGSGARLNLLA